MRNSVRKTIPFESRLKLTLTEQSQSGYRTEEQKSDTTSREPIFKPSTSNRQSTIAEQQTVHSQQTKVLQELKHKWVLQKVLQRLKRISVLDNQEPGSTPQQWQKSGSIEEGEHEEESPYLFRKYDWPLVAAMLVIGAGYVLFAWFLSIDMVLQVQEDNTPIMLSLLALMLVDLAINLNTMQIGTGWAAKTRIKIFYRYLKTESFFDLYLALFVVAMILKPSFQITMFLEATAIIALAHKCLMRISRVRTQLDSLKQIVLVDCFLLLLFVGHINALFLYLSTLYRPYDNWLTRINIANNSWAIKYLYSLYWACTTIVTVGFGDITPTNECEVFVTIFVELSGSAVFGYLINIIGMTMSQIKKEKQSLDQELSIAEKLIKCLNLKDDLSIRLRSFLKDHRKASNYFSLKDETRIMDKLKPDLRNQIMQQTNIKVIKKCLFFLTYFSRSIQDVIALKLVKRVFQPNQILSLNNRCIYIVNQGKVDLQAQKIHFNKPICKTLRTITQDAENNSITSNTYGYTALLLKRNINLSAISKQFTISYELSQEDFEDCIAQYPQDYEAVSELKDFLITTHIAESIEGPELVDPKHHYVPVKMLVVRRWNYTSRQPRVRRRKLPSEKVAFDRYEFIGDTADEIATHNTTTSVGAKKSHQQFPFASRAALNDSEIDEINEQVDGWLENFDQIKHYTKYFANGNLTNIIKRFCPTSNMVMKRRCGVITRNYPMFSGTSPSGY